MCLFVLFYVCVTVYISRGGGGGAFNCQFAIP